MKDMDLDALESVSGGLQLGGLAQAQTLAAAPAGLGVNPFAQFGQPYGFDPSPLGAYGGYPAYAFDNGCQSSCSPCGGQQDFNPFANLGNGLGNLGLGNLGNLGNLINGLVPNGAIQAGAQPLAGLGVSPLGGSVGPAGVPGFYGQPAGGAYGGAYGASGSPLGSPLGSVF